MLTKTEIATIKLTLNFLEELVDKQSAQGCNDYELDNTDENWEIYKQAIYSNKDSYLIESFEINGRPPLNKKILTYDFFLVGACKSYLKSLLDGNQ